MLSALAVFCYILDLISGGICILLPGYFEMCTCAMCVAVVFFFQSLNILFFVIIEWEWPYFVHSITFFFCCSGDRSLCSFELFSLAAAARCRVFFSILWHSSKIYNQCQLNKHQVFCAAAVAAAYQIERCDVRDVRARQIVPICLITFRRHIFPQSDRARTRA